MRHTISVLVENEFGVLARIAGLFSGRGYNIQSLTVAETGKSTISSMTIVTDGDDAMIEQILKQLRKLISVIEVVDMSSEKAVERGLALVKLRFTKAKEKQIKEVIKKFKGRLIEQGTQSVIVEFVNTPARLKEILKALKPFGILDFEQTGSIVMERIL